jgi:hypothetical protein
MPVCVRYCEIQFSRLVTYLIKILVKKDVAPQSPIFMVSKHPFKPSLIMELNVVPFGAFLEAALLATCFVHPVPLDYFPLVREKKRTLN